MCYEHVFMSNSLCFQTRFLKLGGTLLDGHQVIKVSPSSGVGGKTTITLRNNQNHKIVYKTKKVIVCAGAWTNDILKPLGVNLPLKVRLFNKLKNTAIFSDQDIF